MMTTRASSLVGQQPSRAAPAASTPPRRHRRPSHGPQRRASLVLVPALLVLLVLLGPAGRVHAAPAPAAATEKGIVTVAAAAAKAGQEQEGRGLASEDLPGDEGDGGLPEAEGSSSGDGDGGGGVGVGRQRPSFNHLEARSRAELEAEGFLCFSTGECLDCSQEEMAQAYCKATQRREEVTCEREETVRSGVESQKKVRAMTTYETCYATAGDDMTSMLRFQALMAVLGGLALYGVRHQKLKHQTLYERRQMSRTRRRGSYSGI